MKKKNFSPKSILQPTSKYFFNLWLDIPGGVKNGKFFTLTLFQKNRPKSMKPSRPTQRKFAFKLSYSTTTTKNRETLYFSIDLFINC